MIEISAFIAQEHISSYSILFTHMIAFRASPARFLSLTSIAWSRAPKTPSIYARTSIRIVAVGQLTANCLVDDRDTWRANIKLAGAAR
jgi:hypothetical protein